MALRIALVLYFFYNCFICEIDYKSKNRPGNPAVNRNSQESAADRISRKENLRMAGTGR